MKRTILNLLSILFFINYSFSQDIINNDLLNQVTNQQLISSTKSNINNIKGSPYINQKFLPVTIDKLSGKNLSARYNAFNDEIEIKKGSSNINYVLNKKSKFSKIQFISSKVSYEAHHYIENNKNKHGYLAQLNPTGNYLLLKKQHITFIEAKPSKTGYDKETPAQFKKTKDKYFIKISDDKIIELQKNKKDFAKLFPKHEKEILSYIKKQNINIKKEIDLIKLVKYINTL